MSCDNVLKMEVVLANGDIVTVSKVKTEKIEKIEKIDQLNDLLFINSIG